MLFFKEKRNTNVKKNWEHWEKALGKENGNFRKSLSIFNSYYAMASDTNSFCFTWSPQLLCKNWLACKMFMFVLFRDWKRTFRKIFCLLVQRGENILGGKHDFMRLFFYLPLQPLPLLVVSFSKTLLRYLNNGCTE